MIPVWNAKHYNKKTSKYTAKGQRRQNSLVKDLKIITKAVLSYFNGKFQICTKNVLYLLITISKCCFYTINTTK